MRSCDAAVKLDIIEKSGSWFSYNGSKIGQGRDNAKEFLRQNPELAEEIAAQVMANADKLLNSKIGRKPAPAPAAKPAEEAAPAPAEAPAAPKANIDIEVDD